MTKNITVCTQLYGCQLRTVSVVMLSMKSKGKGLPITGHEGPEGEQMYSCTLPSTSALDGGRWSAPRPGRFTLRKDPIPIVQEAGWAPQGRSGRVRKISPPPQPGFDPPDRSARSESLYRLSYRGPLMLSICDIKEQIWGWELSNLYFRTESGKYKC